MVNVNVVARPECADAVGCYARSVVVMSVVIRDDVGPASTLVHVEVTLQDTLLEGIGGLGDLWYLANGLGSGDALSPVMHGRRDPARAGS